MTRTKALLAVLLVLAVSVAFADVKVFVLGGDITTTLHNQTSGRRFAVGFTCATLSAVAQAGREVIDPPQPPDSAFQRKLEQLGYPPAGARRAQARQAAQEYVQHISVTVQQQVGGKAARLIRKDGTIDCLELQRLAATQTGN